MKKLKIVQIAPVWFPIPPGTYGGIERVVSTITEGLVKAGHEVTLFAPPESKTTAKLISVYPQSTIKAGMNWGESRIWNIQNIAAAYKYAQETGADIVHNHIDKYGLFFDPISSVPTVHTMHNQLFTEDHYDGFDEKSRSQLYKQYSQDLNMIFISEKQKSLTELHFKYSPVIYNPIDATHFTFNPKPEELFVWVGAIRPEKGPHTAIAIAKKMGKRLILAGRLNKDLKKDVEFFETEVKPHLSDIIQYIGELDTTKLSELYGRAEAFIYPIEWEEPFGLVMIEAMACGTPVFSFRRGSVPEVVEHGKTGFVVDTEDEMIEALKQVKSIDRTYCREYAITKFGAEQFVEAHEAVYASVLGSSSELS